MTFVQPRYKNICNNRPVTNLTLDLTRVCDCSFHQNGWYSTVGWRRLFGTLFSGHIMPKKGNFHVQGPADHIVLQVSKHDNLIYLLCKHDPLFNYIKFQSAMVATLSCTDRSPCAWKLPDSNPGLPRTHGPSPLRYHAVSRHIS